VGTLIEFAFHDHSSGLWEITLRSVGWIFAHLPSHCLDLAALYHATLIRSRQLGGVVDCHIMEEPPPGATGCNPVQLATQQPA
jgi:hypothetical protein